MAWFRREALVKSSPHPADPLGRSGFGAPFHVAYGLRPAPGVSDNAGYYAYLTMALPPYTPIGGGVPNKRDIGTAMPSWSRQSVGLSRVGNPGILSGAFVAGPLTNLNDLPS